MSSTTMTPTYHAPTAEFSERSDGHFMPFVVALAIFLLSGIVSIGIVGLPH